MYGSESAGISKAKNGNSFPSLSAQHYGNITMGLSDESFNQCLMYRCFTPKNDKNRWFCWQKNRVLLSPSSSVSA